MSQIMNNWLELISVHDKEAFGEYLKFICFEIQIYLCVSIHFMLCCSGRFGPKGRLCAVRERVCVYVRMHTERWADSEWTLCSLPARRSLKSGNPICAIKHHMMGTAWLILLLREAS